uniref:Equilibrative nucleoside transporter 1 n=1 Tax=Elaeophora elaphi TaxID=1147741 RepID=A0A158Q8P7_9BILA
MLLSRKPVDRYNAVYLIILLNGFGILITWNMWITIAPAYYVKYKLIEVDENGTEYASPYAANFLSYLMLASNLPNFALNLFNLFFTFKGSLQKRISLSLMVMALMCLITLIFTVIDTSSMITIFFIITIATVVIQNAACGLYQNSFYGLVAVFPPRYTNALFLGSNICGTFVSIVNIITLLVTKDIKTAAFFYFLVSLLAVLACFGSLFVLVRLDFCQYYMQRIAEKMETKNLDKTEFEQIDSKNKIGLKTKAHDDITEILNNSAADDLLTIDNKLATNFRMKLSLYCDIFKKKLITELYKCISIKIRTQCFNIWFIFVVTLVLYPTVMLDVKFYSETGKYNFFIPEKLFIPVTTYLFFNFFACFGSFLANFVQWPKSKLLVVPVVAQVAFIPLMLFCNFRPAHRTWGVWIYNTWIYLALVIAMSTCSGYFSALALMYAPKQVEASKSSVAGMIAAFFLIFGVVCGALLTPVILWFIDSAGPFAPRK